MNYELSPEYGLNPKQIKFCKEYIKDLNGTRSYRKVYKVKDDNVAAVSASNLLRNAKIKKYLEVLMVNREKRLEISADNVLKELARIGFASISNVAEVETKEIEDSKGKKMRYKALNVHDTEDIDEDTLTAIGSIKEGKHGIEVKMHDKVRALELLGKHLGTFIEKVDVNVTNHNQLDDLTEEELDQMKKLLLKEKQ
ncbi:MAG: terminase small subunit [Peptostreptococcaceae bacterium]